MNSCRPYGPRSLGMVDPDLTVGAISLRRFAPVESVDRRVSLRTENRRESFKAFAPMTIKEFGSIL